MEYNDNYFYPDYLMHYGVKGMKWGHRRNAMSVSAAGHRFSAKTMGVYERMNQGLANKTNRNRYKTSANAFRTVKNDQLKKAEAAQAAANAKRDQKIERKQAIKSTYKDIQKNASLKDKLTYNNATRKQAAKYMVDGKMSMSDATKKANDVAKRNSAIALGVIGAYTMAELYRIHKM